MGTERDDVPVTGQVDFDQLFDSLRRKFEDGVVGSYSCVVDEDTGSAELFSNLVCGSIDCVGIGNVALDIMCDDYLSAEFLIHLGMNDV